MSQYKQGEIVLVPFPYSDDLSQSKPRPVLIISNDSLENEVICVQITSKTNRIEFTSISILLEDVSLELPVISVIRTHLIHTIQKKSIIKRISSLTNEDKLNRVLENLGIMLQRE